MMRLISLTISFGLLAFLYYLIDIDQVLVVWKGLKPAWFLLAMVSVVPLMAITVWRLQRLSPKPISFFLGLRVNLQASTMNLIMPAKLGDIGKGAFLAQHTHTATHTWFILCTFEKLMDLAALMTWCTVGLIFIPELAPGLRLFILPVGAVTIAFFAALSFPDPLLWLVFKLNRRLPPTWQKPGQILMEEWHTLHTLMAARPLVRWQAMGLSLLLWGGHLVQIWLLGYAIGLDLSILSMMALVPLGILCGLIPLTIGGLGTRDAAFVALLGPLGTPAAAATLALLTAFRYIVPALLGLPLLGKDIAKWRRKKR